MSQPDPVKRLVDRLPPDGVRRVLARGDAMEKRGEHGVVAQLILGPGGCWQIEVREVYSWRGEDASR